MKSVQRLSSRSFDDRAPDARDAAIVCRMSLVRTLHQTADSLRDIWWCRSSAPVLPDRYGDELFTESTTAATKLLTASSESNVANARWTIAATFAAMS